MVEANNVSSSLNSEIPIVKEVYVGRLERLIRLRREHEPELNSQGVRLLDRAIFATYCACRETGQQKKAHDILGK